MPFGVEAAEAAQRHRLAAVLPERDPAGRFVEPPVEPARRVLGRSARKRLGDERIHPVEDELAVAVAVRPQLAGNALGQERLPRPGSCAAGSRSARRPRCAPPRRRRTARRPRTGRARRAGSRRRTRRPRPAARGRARRASPRGPGCGAACGARPPRPRRPRAERPCTGPRRRGAGWSADGSRGRSSGCAPPRARAGSRPRARGRSPRRRAARPARYEVAVIVIPPRAFCSSVTRTLSAGSSSAAATSSRIFTVSASQKAPSLRNDAR